MRSASIRGLRRAGLHLAVVLSAALGSNAAPAAAPKQRLNPLISLLEQRQPVMGLYAPSNFRYGQASAPQRTPTELARATIAYEFSDFIFDGSMEYDFERTFPTFAAYARALNAENHLSRTPYLHIAYPMVVKIHEIAPDPTLAARRIGQQLDLGVSGVVFVGVESPDEVRRGIAAMRYKSHGGTRPESVGIAPEFWGVSEQEYRRRADLWPLNPEGELLNWVVIESREGLRNVRAIAAVKGIGTLLPGAGTLRQVFSTPGADGNPVVDEDAWEAAIQKVLAACKEFHVACGIPSSPDQIEQRMQQGFSVFLMHRDDAGFETIRIGRKLAGR